MWKPTRINGKASSRCNDGRGLRADPGFGAIPAGSSVGLAGDRSLPCKDRRPRRFISAFQEKSKVSGLALREREASHRDGKHYSTGPGLRTGARSAGTQPAARRWDLTEQRKPRGARREKTGSGRWLWKPAEEGEHHGTSPCARGSRGEERLGEGRTRCRRKTKRNGRRGQVRSLGLRTPESSHQRNFKSKNCKLRKRTWAVSGELTDGRGLQPLAPTRD